jgi:N12 class adenine-specific DNA methylase
MALITSALERERDLLQKEVLKFVGAPNTEQLDHEIQSLKNEIARLVVEKKRMEEDAMVRARLYEDRLDGETMRNEALQMQLDTVRETMGSGIDSLRVQMESGLSVALARVDQMETLLWTERAKSKKYLKLLCQLVDKEDLDVLLSEDDDGAKKDE